MPGMVRDWRGRIKGKPTQYTAIHTCRNTSTKRITPNLELRSTIDKKEPALSWSGKGVYQSNSVQS